MISSNNQSIDVLSFFLKMVNPIINLPLSVLLDHKFPKEKMKCAQFSDTPILTNPTTHIFLTPQLHGPKKMRKFPTKNNWWKGLLESRAINLLASM